MNEQTINPIVFLVFANEQEEHARYLRTLAEEARRLRRALEQAETQGLCHLEVRTNTTLGDIRDGFRKYANRIAHFHSGGHADSYRLRFEAAGGKNAAIVATGFAEFLAQQAGLHLPIILFYGQSGVGKSSVLAAGLLPRLVQKQSVIYQRRDQAKGLTATLAAALSTTDVANLCAAWRTAEARAGNRLTVILDQVFEFYVQWGTEQGENPERVAQRQEWIAALKAGENPFDAATLAKLGDAE